MISLGFGKNVSNVACLRKGVVAGRVVTALNDLYTQIVVLDKGAMDISRGAIKEIKKDLGALKRNFKSAPEEVGAIRSRIGTVAKLIRHKDDPASREILRTDIKDMQKNFRKALGKGLRDCGSVIRDGDLYDINYTSIADVTDDHGYYAARMEPENPAPPPEKNLAPSTEGGIPWGIIAGVIGVIGAAFLVDRIPLKPTA